MASRDLMLSICVPVFNEEQNIPPLIERITAVMARQADWTYEIIFADDASEDGSWAAMKRAAGHDSRVRCLQLDRRSGESAAEDAALKAARGRFLMTIDADLENDPADIPVLLAGLAKSDCVCGSRTGRRRDGLVKAASSWVANAVRNATLRDRISDSGCTYRVFKRECFQSIVMYNGFHRFLPTLFKMNGYSVTEVPVRHSARIHGRSKYGVSNRLFRSLADMLAVRWMRARRLDYRIKQEI